MLILKNISFLFLALFSQQIAGMSIDGSDSLAKREPCDDGYSGVETSEFSQISGDDAEEDYVEDDEEDDSVLAKRDVEAAPVAEPATLSGLGRFHRPPIPTPVVPTPAPLAVTPRNIQGILCLRRCLRRQCIRIRNRRLCFIRQVACVRRCQRLFF